MSRVQSADGNRVLLTSQSLSRREVRAAMGGIDLQVNYTFEGNFDRSWLKEAA